MAEDNSTQKYDKKLPSYVLDDLSSRFIINTRQDEVKSIVRIFFQIEMAYWFYLDFHCVENHKLKESTMKEFSAALIKHVPQLQKHMADFDTHFEQWKAYKRTIGTYGAIIIDKTMKNVLLVQSFGSKNSWGFPKGKINQNEPPVDCAAREVLEETGFDIKPYVDPCEYLEKHFNEQLNRLYLIADIPLDTVFQPKTRREIRDIQWFPLEMLLSAKTPESSLKETVGSNLNLYTVLPYLRVIKKWINDRQSCATPEALAKQTRRAKQQKLFSQQNQSQYHEYMQLKKGKITPKNFANQSKNAVRYSRDILNPEELQAKQGKPRSTVGETLFGNREPRVEVMKIPEVDTNSFYSKTWFNFTLDTDALLALCPRPGNYFLPTRRL